MWNPDLAGTMKLWYPPNTDGNQPCRWRWIAKLFWQQVRPYCEGILWRPMKWRWWSRSRALWLGPHSVHRASCSNSQGIHSPYMYITLFYFISYLVKGYIHQGTRKILHTIPAWIETQTTMWWLFREERIFFLKTMEIG